MSTEMECTCIFSNVYGLSTTRDYHGGLTEHTLITNLILSYIPLHTFSISGGYFKPPISLIRSIISITKMVSSIGKISLSSFPSPTISQMYKTRLRIARAVASACQCIPLPGISTTCLSGFFPANE